MTEQRTKAPTRKPRGQYAGTRLTQSKILDAALEAFAKTGFRSTTMREIAEAAGISERGLVHHFQSKSQLLYAALDRHEQEVVSRFNPEGPRRIEDLISVVGEDARSPIFVELHITLSAEATSNGHPAHERYRDRYSSIRDWATEIFRSSLRTGEIESDLSAEELARCYVALSDGLQLQWLYDRNALDAASVLRNFLDSLAPKVAAKKAL